MHSNVRQKKVGENDYIVCHTFPVKITENVWRQKKQYLGITKNRYQVQFISDLIVWFMMAKRVQFILL